MPHTPGPWAIEPIFGDEDLSIVLGYPKPEAGNPVLLANVCPYEDGDRVPSTREEARANASLIAAAPDLLTECRLLLDQLESRYDGCEDSVTLWMGMHIRDLRAAIAKAEGRA